LGDEYERLVASGDPARMPSLMREEEEEPIAIDYTSGTTGRPNGVVYTYRGAYLNALGEVIEAELGHHPVYLWTLAGYFADDEATEAAFSSGWFHSGDLAVWHPDNAIELRDRGKDVIISGGENISSIEVEQAVCAHPAVLEAAVVAVPHDRWGERPKAFVTLQPGEEVSEQELIAFCGERLAHFKCPDTIAFGPLPKTSTGKVQKFALREPEWAGRERRIN
jgi:acyl-CoA synthetase (AMP-forming)/AMP-acid ligase II